MELQNTKDEIEFFYKEESLGKVNLIEHSTDEDRTNIARALHIKAYDRYIFIQNDKIRLDSNDSLYFQKEIVMYNPDKYISDFEDYSDDEAFRYVEFYNRMKNDKIENDKFENFQVLLEKDINITSDVNYKES